MVRYTAAFANQKGGVGKTTSCINIAAAVAAKGYRVLLVDCDPQGNTTSGLGISKKEVRHTTYEGLLGEAVPQDCVLTTGVENLFLVPSTIQLAGAEFELIDMEKREGQMRRFLDGLTEDYDFAMIDCPPSLSMLTVNALTASDGVIIPMQCEYYALEGLSQLMLTIRKVKQLYNSRLSVLGILITMYNGRLNLSVQVLDEIKKYYADKLFPEPIPRSVKLTEAPSYGVPAVLYDKYNKGTQAYGKAAEEILRRTGFTAGG
ncbi:MAG: ParA family protein [Ruminococcaceae bacterium]|nr:ParA family protein [Oscillospiraceae bacterium]